MPEYIFVPEESLATIARATADDPLTALNETDIGPLPRKVTVVQVIGTYWIMDDQDSEVVRQQRAEPRQPAP